MQWTFIKVYLQITTLSIKRFTIRYLHLFLGNFEDFEHLVDFPVAVEDVERSSPQKSLNPDSDSDIIFLLKQ